MAQRRMFSKKITDTDLFLDMPMSAQCLYFHLNMEADDDGFLGNAKTVRRKIGASEDDLKLLMAKEFIIPFESGIVVIKDWKIHNYIQKDRYNQTIFLDEKSKLTINENNSYQLWDTEWIQHGNKMDTNGVQIKQPTDESLDNTGCVQNGYSLDTQVRLGKDRLGKSKDRLVVVKDIYDYYEKNGFGAITHKTITDFDYWVQDLIKIGANEEDAILMIIHALGIAIDNNVRKYAYVNSILTDWERRKFLSVEQVQAEDKKFKPNNNFRKNTKKEKIPEYINQPTNESADESPNQDVDRKLKEYLAKKE